MWVQITVYLQRFKSPFQSVYMREGRAVWGETAINAYSLCHIMWRKMGWTAWRRSMWGARTRTGDMRMVYGPRESIQKYLGTGGEQTIYVAEQARELMVLELLWKAEESKASWTSIRR